MPDAITQAPSTPAPAPTAAESVDTLSASEQAVSKGFEAFKEERHKERFPETEKKPAAVAAPAKPVEPVTEADGDEDTSAELAPAASVATPAKPAPRVLSPAQIKLNESIRQAVERTTAPLNAEIARLRAQLAPAPVTPPVAEKTADLEPDPSDAATYPNGQFDAKFVKDLASWQTRQDIKAFHDTQNADRQQTERLQTFQARASQTREKIATALKADPDLLKDIDPELLSLTPSIALKPGDTSTFGHVIADWLTDTDSPVELLQHLSNREEVHRLAKLSPAAFLREQGRIEATFAASTSPASPTPKEPTPPITQATDPAHTLGRQPVEKPDAITSALQDGGFTAYKNAKRARGVVHYAG